MMGLPCIQRTAKKLVCNGRQDIQIEGQGFDLSNHGPKVVGIQSQSDFAIMYASLELAQVKSAKLTSL